MKSPLELVTIPEGYDIQSIHVGEAALMLDLETLATPDDLRPGELVEITEIGAVFFDAASGDIFREFQLFPKPGNGTCSVDTVQFWMRQIEEGRRPAWMTERNTPRNEKLWDMERCLNLIATLCREMNVREVWCKGMDFDLSILRAHYAARGMPTPWHFAAKRDLRTLMKCCGVSAPYGSVCHDSLQDCRDQIGQLMQCRKMLTKEITE